MKTKLFILLILTLIIQSFDCPAQKQSSFSYDAAGNRISRQSIVLDKAQKHTTLPESLTESGNIRIYPNPAGERVHIEITGSQTPAYRAELYDGNGRLMQASQSTSSRHEINLSRLPAGIYLLRISDTRGSTEFRIIKRS